MPNAFGMGRRVMGQLSSNTYADNNEADTLSAADAKPEVSEDRDSTSIQSPNFELSAAANPTSVAASDDGSAPSDQSDNSDGGDSSSPAGAPAPLDPRQRIPAKQIGQIPHVDEPRILAQSPDLGTAWQESARQENARQQQIDQINQSDPYISPEDGRWKKQLVDYPTGAVHETDILDSGTGQIDRRTGNIQTQTAQGPQVISVDPQQKRLAEIVNQKAQARVQGSPDDASISAAKSALSDTQRQLQAYQGVPDRMAAQIAKYTQATLPPNNSAAATQLQSLQTAFANWKQQNPGYAQLISQRDALANQIQTQTAAKAQRDAQAAQLLTSPQYVQWNGNTPPAPASSLGEQGNSTPSSDISIQDLDSRAGIIAAQTGYPAGLAYASALREAKQQGAQTVDGSSIDDAIAGVQPVAEGQLTKMPGAQLSKAFQTGLITRQQLITAVKPRNAPSDQTAAPADDPDATNSPSTSGQDADPVAQSVAGLTAKAADLRQKIQTAFDTGGADGVSDLATYRAALADTEDQLHAGTQSLLNRVPPDLQRRIANAVAPNIDWNDAAARNAQDPMANFATENIGSALREQSMPPYLQIGIRKTAIARGVNPDLAAHIANQALGEGAVRDLLRVLRGADIDPGKAQTLQDMGLLQPSDPADPASPLHLTEDAQRLLPPGAQRFVQIRPDLARYTPSPDPAHGSALYQNAVAGMEHFSDTAQKTLPAPITADAIMAPNSPSASPSVPDPTAGLVNGAANSTASNDQGSGSTSGTSGASGANADGSPNQAAAIGSQAGIESPQDQASAPHPAFVNLSQQAIQDASEGKKAYRYDPKNGLQFKPESLADGLKQALQDGVVDKDWAAQHLPEFQDAQDKYQALQKAAGSAQVLKALLHGAGPGAAFAAAFPLGASGGAALGGPIGAWVGGILGAPTGPGEIAAIPAGTGVGAGIGYLLGGLGAGTLAAFAARKGLQALGEYSDAIKSLNASAELHPIADATGELATLALNPLSAAEKVAGEGFSYAVGAPAVVKSISNLTKLGAQAAKGATEIGSSGAMAATKAVGGQLAKAAAAGLIFEGAVRPAFEGAVWVAANTLGIHTDAPQPPTVSSLLQSAALSVLLAGHGLEFKEVPAGQVTSAMIRGKVREDLGIPLDSTDPQHLAQVEGSLKAKGLPINANNVQALTAPLSPAEQNLYTTLSRKIYAMRAAGKFDGKTGNFVSATQFTVPGASERSASTLSGGVATVERQTNVPPESDSRSRNYAPINSRLIDRDTNLPGLIIRRPDTPFPKPLALQSIAGQVAPVTTQKLSPQDEPTPDNGLPKLETTNPYRRLRGSNQDTEPSGVLPSKGSTPPTKRDEPDYQAAIDKIHYAAFRNLPFGQRLPMTLTVTNDKKLILSKVGSLPPNEAGPQTFQATRLVVFERFSSLPGLRPSLAGSKGALSEFGRFGWRTRMSGWAAQPRGCGAGF